MSDVAIGIDVGGTKALALVVARDGRVLGETIAATPHDATREAGEATAGVLTGLVNELAATHGLVVSETPVGVGLPGLMRKDGRLAFAPNLQSASGADLGSLLGTALVSSRVFCENDANCAAVAEHEWGAGRGVDDFVMVTLGTGIGGGIIADGRLLQGRSGFASEIGHMVVEAHGIPCTCGGMGCWERYASGSGLRRLIRETAKDGGLPTLLLEHGSAEDIRPEDVTSAAARGLDEALDLLRQMSWWLALGLSNLVAILDTGHFVIGGGLSSASDLVLPMTRDYLTNLVEGYRNRPAITVTASMFGPRSGAMGAALTAFVRDS
ncbi:MAG: ROK family protein [Acidimicrobiales bacterium]